MYNFTLPVPPSINGYYGHIAKGNRVIKYIKKEGKEYRKFVIHWCIRNKMQLRANLPLQMDIKYYFKDKRKRDLDNPLKSLLDALTHAEVYEDDDLIQKMTIEKFYDKENPRVEITISQYEPKEE
jgi:crossover junction endodeoxyribonuclease RusA